MEKRIIHAEDFLRDNLFVYWRLRPSDELDRFWEQFLRENEDLRDQFSNAIMEFDNLGITDNQFLEDAIEVEKTLNQRMRQKKGLRTLYASLSAAIFVLAFITGLFYISNDKENDQPVIAPVSIGNIMEDPRVQLQTGNDILDINDNSTLDLSEKKNSALIQDSLTQKEIKLEKDQTNKLVVPFGKRSIMVLSDGSRVYLNSGTAMDFPTAFSPHCREIWVEGEIFIDVVKQNNVPFIIHTPHSQITVHGTSFNVSSYAEENRECVVLVTGAVEVKSENNSLLLKPNEMAVIENGLIEREQVDVKRYISWKDGYLQLGETTLHEVLTKIGRYYNVAFQFQQDLYPELHKKTCYGKLFLSNSLDEVLDAFSGMTSYTYEKNNSLISIK